MHAADVSSTAAEIPVGHGQTRRGWVVVACLGYSCAGAGSSSARGTPDLIAAIERCLWTLGALPKVLVWDRQAGLTPATAGRPTRPTRSAASCASTGTSARRPTRRPRAASNVCRTPWSARSTGSQFANQLDFQLQLDDWFEHRTNGGQHKTLRCRPLDRLVEEREPDDAAAQARRSR